MRDGRCNTCVYVKRCEVYKAATELVSSVTSEMFGCVWHMDAAEHYALTSKPKEATDVLENKPEA